MSNNLTTSPTSNIPNNMPWKHVVQDLHTYLYVYIFTYIMLLVKDLSTFAVAHNFVLQNWIIDIIMGVNWSLEKIQVTVKGTG